MRKSQEIQLRLEQSLLILDRKELLTSKQALELQKLVNYPQYIHLRQWLLSISVLFYDKAGMSEKEDSFILTKFGRFLKDLVGDMDRMKVIPKEEIETEDYGQ